MAIYKLYFPTLKEDLCRKILENVKKLKLNYFKKFVAKYRIMTKIYLKD